MKIIVDVMSGDNAPLEMIKGAAMAKNEFQPSDIIATIKCAIRRTAMACPVTPSKKLTGSWSRWSWPCLRILNLSLNRN